MPNGKTPEDTGEHLMALYGHVEGLKKDVNHLHRDIEKINNKVEDIEKKTDRLLYWIKSNLLSSSPIIQWQY
jgi:uncharacterized protein Yka (UPF0111/DUF47 family)